MRKNKQTFGKNFCRDFHFFSLTLTSLIFLSPFPSPPFFVSPFVYFSRQCEHGKLFYIRERARLPDALFSLVWIFKNAIAAAYSELFAFSILSLTSSSMRNKFPSVLTWLFYFRFYVDVLKHLSFIFVSLRNTK